MLLHVLAHVVADELVSQVDGELLGQLGLADPCRAGEEETPGRTIRLTESGSRPLDRRDDGSDGVILSKHHPPQGVVQGAEALLVRHRRLLFGDARHARDHALDVGRRHPNRLRKAGRVTRLRASVSLVVLHGWTCGDAGRHTRDRARSGCRHLRARFIEHVDGAVG